MRDKRDTENISSGALQITNIHILKECQQWSKVNKAVAGGTSGFFWPSVIFRRLSHMSRLSVDSGRAARMLQSCIKGYLKTI